MQEQKGNKDKDKIAFESVWCAALRCAGMRVPTPAVGIVSVAARTGRNYSNRAENEVDGDSLAGDVKWEGGYGGNRTRSRQSRRWSWKEVAIHVE